MNKLKLKDIAKEIDGFLKKFEADPKINIDRSPTGNGLHDYYNAGASAGGRFVYIYYVSYQYRSNLTKEEAIEYLEWLKAGNVGKHYECFKKFNNR